MKINELINVNKVTLKEISHYMGMSSTGLKQTLERRTLRIDHLEKISSFFNKPISYFFDEKTDIESEDLNYREKYLTLLEKYSQLLEKCSKLGL